MPLDQEGLDRAGNRIAVRFCYGWHGDSERRSRSCGSANREFDDGGLMRRRITSINDLSITETDRLFRWPFDARPTDRPFLSVLGF